MRCFNLISFTKLNAETTSQVTGNIPQNVNFAIKATFIKNLLPTIPETLISTTGLVVVPAYSKNKRSDFIDKIKKQYRITISSSLSVN